MTFDRDQFLPYRLAVTATQVSRMFEARYAQEAGLSIPEWRVMAHLGAQGAVSIRDITLRVNLDKSVVSRAASRLEGRGLICKSANKEDLRLLSIELTEAGNVLMGRLGQIATAFQAELMAELGHDAGSILRILSVLDAAAQKTLPAAD